MPPPSARPRRPRSPRLDAEIVHDDDAVHEAIGELLGADATYRRQTRAILAAQSELRTVLNEKQWRAFMNFEEAVSARSADAMIVIARWAFVQARRSTSR